jgi:hypothetical protein
MAVNPQLADTAHLPNPEVQSTPPHGPNGRETGGSSPGEVRSASKVVEVPAAATGEHPAQKTHAPVGGTPTEAPVATLQITVETARALMERLLHEMAAGGTNHGRATDLHINSGRPPDYRIEKMIRSARTVKLTEQDVILLSNAIMTDLQRSRFEKNRCVDFSYHVEKTRFRITSSNRSSDAASPSDDSRRSRTSRPTTCPSST